MVVTRYILNKDIKEKSQLERLRIALVADLHGEPYKEVLAEIQKAGPDMIAVAGDLMKGGYSEEVDLAEQENMLGFLRESAAAAPTFFSLGNHETFMGKDGFADIMPIVKTGAVLLDDAALQWKGISIGGLSSALSHVPVEDRAERPREEYRPNLRWLDEFDRLCGFKILLCHQPEYYTKYVKSTSVDMILSGHAHGGQWRFFGRGVFAPGQGLFPKLTSGVHEERLIISRGLANTAGIPRICNPPELVIVDVV
ncbi:MAG: metallophosphoesterase [Clostridiales bacterium]|nr:metallophosphoesterase [Clostridiales bacterium]